MTESRPSAALEQLAIDTVRVLAMDAVEAAKCGHPGTPMALAPLGYELWTRHLKHDPTDPTWIDRDRFVLSAGHASMLLYSLLHLTGYDLTLDEVRAFRQWGTRTPGHPEVHLTPGVETTTGPLGQGVANSVGMAVAERWLAARFNRPGHTVIDHRTWVVCSDGDLMEGVSHEAAELAGHQKLGKLTWIFDDNRITIEGNTALASSTDQGQRFLGYGWHVLHVDDGNDLVAMDAALRAARAETERPTLIVLRTTIGFGSPNKAGHHDTHGAALGAAEVEATKRNIGYPTLDPFFVDRDALNVWREAGARGRTSHAEWNGHFESYRAEHPELAVELLRSLRGDLPADWDSALPTLADGKADATRNSSGKILQALAARIPELVGGSADLGSSNKTDIDGSESLLPATPDGRILHFGVREHAMGSILNGVALHGGLRVFGGTFLIFSDYMRPAIRLASLSHLPVLYVFTHDSIGLGEDGPTHQPVEQVMTLRMVPGLMDLRPADPAETAVAWRAALTRKDGPAFLALTRQKVPAIDRTGSASAEGLLRGGYVLADDVGVPDVILIGSGSEVQLALRARETLAARGVAARVVSLPSWYLFGQQTKDYRDSVLPPRVTARVSVEAGTTVGWERWIGSEGEAIGLDHFGASAPAEVLYEKFGITAERVAQAAERLVEFDRARRDPVDESDLARTSPSQGRA